ncbi:phenazine biosynthesis [Fusarium longipes]|uniref:Phenazine biosynthesis n=1 Tax=Fusarium longipes TaxID=694270 RepID=A0A395T5Z1_9HYPO|nr:phenazine biosynthesis [Fusarium longipes]
MVSSSVTYYNAFASDKVLGNPAGVIILPESSNQPKYDKDGGFPYDVFPPASSLQTVATQLDYPMIAYAVPLKQSSDTPDAPHYAVRWFNPSNEAPLCGHATLALSQHLFSTQPNSPQTLKYLTRLHGVVSASLQQSPFEDAKLVGIEFPELLDLPSVPKTGTRWEEVRDLFENATGVQWEGKGEPVGLFEADQYLLLEYSPELDLKALAIDPQKLAPIAKFIYIFQISASPSEHIHTRVINVIGDHIKEDIATGSAHRAIIPHALSNADTTARLKQHHPDFSGNTFKILQQSKEGGELTVEWLRDTKSVRIMGKAVQTGENSVEI